MPSGNWMVLLARPTTHDLWTGYPIQAVTTREKVMAKLRAQEALLYNDEVILIQGDALFLKRDSTLEGEEDET